MKYFGIYSEIIDGEEIVKSKTIDVINCKDCKYWKINIIAIPTDEIDRTMYCTRYMWMVHTDADDFCSRGEKKDGVD